LLASHTSATLHLPLARVARPRRQRQEVSAAGRPFTVYEEKRQAESETAGVMSSHGTYNMRLFQAGVPHIGNAFS